MLTVDRLGPTDGWKSGHIIAMLVLGVALLGAFVLWETIYPHPLMPPHIWKDRNFTFVCSSATAQDWQITDLTDYPVVSPRLHGLHLGAVLALLVHAGGPEALTAHGRGPPASPGHRRADIQCHCRIGAASDQQHASPSARIMHLCRVQRFAGHHEAQQFVLGLHLPVSYSGCCWGRLSV